jgi:ribosomal protein S18 acetylase RimI-like enzyme
VRSSNEGALRLYRRLGFEGGWDVEELTKRL